MLAASHTWLLIDHVSNCHYCISRFRQACIPVLNTKKADTGHPENDHDILFVVIMRTLIWARTWSWYEQTYNIHVVKNCASLRKQCKSKANQSANYWNEKSVLVDVRCFFYWFFIGAFTPSPMQSWSIICAKYTVQTFQFPGKFPSCVYSYHSRKYSIVSWLAISQNSCFKYRTFLERKNKTIL